MRARVPFALLAAAAAVLTAPGLPAGADHTDPGTPIKPIVPHTSQSTDFGEGSWTHIANFGGAGAAGTDLKFFHRGGSIYVGGGNLGQTQLTSVGQRILRLTDETGEVNPEFVADHGSAYCPDVTNARGTTGLQHDTAITPRLYGADFYAEGEKPDAELLIDNTDAISRCHDAPGGGLELVDISGLGEEGFEPREVHLTRHTGFSHTVTVDASRPWIVYNSTSDFGVDPTDDENRLGIGAAWIDVLDIRTCLGNQDKTLEEKRALCQPKVFRIPFQYEWAVAETPDGAQRQPSACHDITARPGRIYCAAPTASIAFDVSGLTEAQGPEIPAPDDPAGDIKGTPLPCTIEDATPATGAATGAKVTNCFFETPLANPADQTSAAIRQVDAYNKMGRPAATGWTYLGHYNNVGRDCGAPGQYTCNTNLSVRSDEGVAIGHESDPSPDGKHLFVTDERGGGIVPPGAACVNSVDNPNGNGGLHVFDMTKKDESGRFTYAESQDGGKAVYISGEVLASPTFCTIHVIEQIPDEQRIIAAWYSQGVKILDYYIDEQGRFAFQETAGYTLLPNDIWAGEVFKIVDNPDETRTYYFVSNDITRGLDVFSWTGPTNKIGEAPARPPAPAPHTPPTQQPRPGNPGSTPSTGMDYAVLTLAGALVPAALVLRRRRLARAA